MAQPVVGPFLCANILHCENDAQLTCSRCRSVVYCRAECQKEHWKAHKEHCKEGASSFTLLALSHEDYLEQLEEVKSGKADTSGEYYLKLRRDGKLYWVPDGTMLVDNSTLQVPMKIKKGRKKNRM